MTRHWLCVTSPENWKVIRERLKWGVDDRYQVTLKEHVSVGDMLVYYVTGRGIAGIFRVVSPYSYEPNDIGFVRKTKRKKRGEPCIYPHRVDISPVIIPRAPVPLDETLRRELIFITDKGKTWEVFVFPMMSLIPSEDFEKIYRRLQSFNLRDKNISSYFT